MDTAPAVELIGIEKRFPGVIANHDVNITVRSQTIHAIIGENGAGKSTLMKTLYGMHRPDEGEITVDGEVAVLGRRVDPDHDRVEVDGRVVEAVVDAGPGSFRAVPRRPEYLPPPWRLRHGPGGRVVLRQEAHENE